MTSETCDDIHVRTKVDDILDVLYAIALIGGSAIVAGLLNLLCKLN